MKVTSLEFGVKISLPSSNLKPLPPPIIPAHGSVSVGGVPIRLWNLKTLENPSF